jgi:hypothetical protein
MQTDFRYEYNDGGTWRPALVLDVTDSNNASLWFVGEGGQLTPTDGAVPRGEAAGHFRERRA